jgi:hypothetical protein
MATSNNVFPAERTAARAFRVTGIDRPEPGTRFMAGGQEYRTVGEPVDDGYRCFSVRCQQIQPGHRYDGAPFTAVITCR